MAKQQYIIRKDTDTVSGEISRELHTLIKENEMGLPVRVELNRVLHSGMLKEGYIINEDLREKK